MLVGRRQGTKTPGPQFGPGVYLCGGRMALTSGSTRTVSRWVRSSMGTPPVAQDSDYRQSSPFRTRMEPPRGA